MTEKQSKIFNHRNFIKTTALALAFTSFAPKFDITQAKSFDSTKENSTRVLGCGKAKIKVSTIGFGCMGLNYHGGLYPSKKFCINLLHQAVDNNYTLFDTAESYGPFINEELVGEGLSKFHKSGKIAITTKFEHDCDYATGKPTGKKNSQPKHIKYVVENSLRRLKIDCIDMLY